MIKYLVNLVFRLYRESIRFSSGPSSKSCLSQSLQSETESLDCLNPERHRLEVEEHHSVQLNKTEDEREDVTWTDD